MPCRGEVMGRESEIVLHRELSLRGNGGSFERVYSQRMKSLNIFTVMKIVSDLIQIKLMIMCL
jgi:hypothetical protein